MRANKVFVEPHEEIVFVLEKILKDSADKIILVVPHNALLVSSAVSLKILARQVNKSAKTIVMVTDDETGSALGTRAGIVVAEKISAVTTDTWNLAKELKLKALEVIDKRKKELLDQRSVEISAESVSEIDPVAVVAKVVDKVEEEVEEKQEATPIIDHPRLKDRVVEVGGITIVAGGDIAQHTDLFIKLKDETKVKEDIELPEPTETTKLEQTLDEIEMEQSKNVVEDEEEEESMLGKDIKTEPVRARVFASNAQKKSLDFIAPYISKLQEQAAILWTKFKNSDRKARQYQIAAGAIFVFFVFAYFRMTSVTVEVKFEQNQVPITKDVQAKVDIAAIDAVGLIIPAEVITKEQTASEEGTATGEGVEGEKAKGLIDISNKSDADITLPAGKAITDISTQLKYTIKSEIKIPKANGATPGQARDVSVEAVEPGDEYNIEVGATNPQFKIDGIETDKLIARAFRDISGGTAEDIIVVSKEDIDKVKASVEAKLKESLKNNIAENISANDILLEGSDTYTVVSATSTVEAGKKAETFSVDVKMTVKAYKVLKTDLEKLAEEVVKLENASTDSAKVDVADLKVTGVSISGNAAKFQLISQADFVEDLSDDEIKDLIKGKGIGGAEEILKNQEVITTARVRYSPFFIPGFLRKVPADTQKITITRTK